MKLTKVRITNFRSIQDSTEFDIDDVTCFVGKNEAGKTALLKALYRLNPINKVDGDFDSMEDYPSKTVTEYNDGVNAGREPAEVVQASYALEPHDIDSLKGIIGPTHVIDEGLTLVLHKGYSNELTYSFKGLPDNPSSPVSMLATHLNRTLDADTLDADTKERLLKTFLSRVPKFLYFDEYYQMKGQDNIESLIERMDNGKLQESDYPLLGFIKLAGLNLHQILDITQTQDLVRRLEAAENTLSQRVLTYWSQNRHLRMQFDIRTAQPNDPPGMETGTNLWGFVRDTRHGVSTVFGARSRGFVWFFSFLAWYQTLQEKKENLILLLDEPGLFLHAKAQGDLLHYFGEELMPHHQLLYSTHSPFMIDPMHFERVRIVQDLSVESDAENLPKEKQGTKVITEVLEATPDSLFPLQGALGYEISQTLFIGPNNLVVEGVSDLLYIQTMSALLQRKGKAGLSPDWVITPVGGDISKVSTFVALIGANTNLNIAVLIDYQKKDHQQIENLYKDKLLKKSQVLTYTDFVENNEADVEDMFSDEFYLELVNGEFGTCLTADCLPAGPSRILHRLEDYFTDKSLPNDAKFNHYRPAFYFSKNLDSLEAELTESDLDRFQNAFDALNQLLVT